MPRFLAVYIGTATAQQKADWDKLPTEGRDAQESAGMHAWGQWAAANRGAIVDGGTPLGKTIRISRTGISSITNTSTGYVIVEAPTHEAAAKLFENHPHFAIFPGDSVEVMECLPIPG